MRKQPEIEDALKTVIRDELALNPLASVQRVRMTLYMSGMHSATNGTLDWHYISKLMKKVRTENLVKLAPENRTEKLVALKERHRILTEKLLDIVEGKPIVNLAGVVMPTQRDRISAANTILKWDMAMLFAEAQINMIDKTQTIEKKHTRAVIMTDTISETRVLSQPSSKRVMPGSQASVRKEQRELTAAQ
jgi:hypothetical protein